MSEVSEMWKEWREHKQELHYKFILSYPHPINDFYSSHYFRWRFRAICRFDLSNDF